MSPGDLEQLKEVVSRFNATKDLKNEYVQSWMQHAIDKMVADSTDLEKLWDVLDALGLRKKLKAIGDLKTPGTIAWTMNREPLKSKPLGLKRGKTAAELGLTVVAHETGNFKAWTSISASGDLPNAFISHERPGENAAYGKGFYTLKGTIGSRGKGAVLGDGAKQSGNTIRFSVDPAAREGWDFKLGPNNIVIFLNRKALTLIPGQSFSDPIGALIEYFLNDESQDTATFEKLKRMLSAKGWKLSPKEKQRIWEALEKQPEVTKKSLEWLDIVSRHLPEDLDHRVDFFEKKLGREMPKEIWYDNLSECVKYYQDRKLTIPNLLREAIWKTFEIIQESKLPARAAYRWIDIVKKTIPEDHPRMNSWIDRKIRSTLADPSNRSPVFMEWLRYHFDQWNHHPLKYEITKHFLRLMNEFDNFDHFVAAEALKDFGPTPESMDLIKILISRRDCLYLVLELFADPRWHSTEVKELIRKIVTLDNREHLVRLAFDVLKLMEPKEPGVADLFEFLLKQPEGFKAAMELLSNPKWRDWPEMNQLLDQWKVDPRYSDALFQKMIILGKHPKGAELFSYFIERAGAESGELFDLARALHNPAWAENPRGPELLERVLKKTNSAALNDLLKRPHWAEHPELLAICDFHPPTVFRLKAAFLKGKSLAKKKPSRVTQSACSLAQELRNILVVSGQVTKLFFQGP